MKAVIFDFDGLIVDTESLWYEVFYQVMKEYGMDLSIEEFSQCIGSHDGVLYDFLDTKCGYLLDRTEVKMKTDQLYQEKINQLMLREGVEEYLREANDLGLKIALASSSSKIWVESFLDKFNIRSYFSVIFTRDDVKVVKPDPELYIKATAALELSPSEIIVFEDSLNGLKAAKEAGLTCVVVPNPITKTLAFEGHFMKLQSMTEIRLGELLDKVK
ncbi:HAD family hydrolase [Bacillus carboniphilus]|uniref:HAD family hydrolase n=1 Tax=Bacillus carboniphilus TaxID=86663 RepID=A0ABY9JS11_9BACI|nr:HAD family hydrolase [Bacillus carboniphilus]WLR42132.1 HAD family hydrolase [Bacillus carboniphilus]